MTDKENEYLFIALGIWHNIDAWGMMLGSSHKDIDGLSFILNDTVFPPYVSHKFMREEVLQIRDYLNDYLERTKE